MDRRKRMKNSKMGSIDDFSIPLSLSANNNVTKHTGEKNVVTIELSYEILCTNLEDCPTPSPSCPS